MGQPIKKLLIVIKIILILLSLYYFGISIYSCPVYDNSLFLVSRNEKNLQVFVQDYFLILTL